MGAGSRWPTRVRNLRPLTTSRIRPCRGDASFSRECPRTEPLSTMRWADLPTRSFSSFLNSNRPRRQLGYGEGTAMALPKLLTICDFVLRRDVAADKNRLAKGMKKYSHYATYNCH